MKSPAKKWRIQTFYFDFHEVLVLLTSQSYVVRYCFFMAFDLCTTAQISHCQKPKSLQTIRHAVVLFLKSSACCCFHSFKIEAVLSEQDSLGFDWTQRKKRREKNRPGKCPGMPNTYNYLPLPFLSPSMNKQWQVTTMTGAINLQLR